jgi:hypothetical protein
MAEPLVDGFQDILAGMQAGLDPEIVGENAYALGINVISRGGLAKTRPGFVRGPQLPAGVFLGMKAWALHNATRLVIVLSGRIVLVDSVTEVVTDLGELLSANATCCFVQADRYMVVMNGVDRPVILEDQSGIVVVRPTPATFPTGPLGEFVFGRVHLSPSTMPGTTENGRPYFVSGDVSQPMDPSSCLDFTETEYWSEGGAHGLPLEMGYVTAFAPIRNASTGTGYGQLLVFAERGVCAFDVSTPRTEWTTAGISQVLFFGPGSVSPWATIPVNGTVIYRAADGLRLISYAAAAAQSGDVLGNVPQSNEVKPYVDTEDAAYFPRISAAAVSNRVFVTAGGVSDVWFKGMIVLDAARAYSLASAAAETAYDGVWQITGRLIGGIAAARRGTSECLFVYCDDGYLWRLDETTTADNGLPIHARLVSRSLFTKSGPDRKRLRLMEAWVRDLTSSGSVVARYRPTGFPVWVSAGEQSYRIGVGSLPQKRHLTWTIPSSPSAPADLGEQAPLYLGSSFQCALDWEGPLTLSLYRCQAQSEQEGPSAPCGDTSDRVVTVPAGAEELGVWLER